MSERRTGPRTGPEVAGIRVKKQFGQHFLRNQAVVDRMLAAVHLDANSSVFEIGCGDGFLTKAILASPALRPVQRSLGEVGSSDRSEVRVWVFEIDPDWASYVRQQCPDDRLTIYEENILEVDFQARLGAHAPWVLLANLPYQITFPILYKLVEHKKLLAEGVVMVQHEVAEKILQTGGRGYGYVSLFLQHHFVWRSVMKVSPGDFYPPPKVYSHLLHFRPRTDAPQIPCEPEFWRFIKACFHQPRRTLRNNLQGYHYDITQVSAQLLASRAQQLSMSDFLDMWSRLQV